MRINGERVCNICREPHGRRSSYCKRCYNTYQRWVGRQPLTMKHTLAVFRIVVTRALAAGATVESVALPVYPSLHPDGCGCVDCTALAENSSEAQGQVHDGVQHPVDCGCWMCAGYPTYEAAVKAGFIKER